MSSEPNRPKSANCTIRLLMNLQCFWQGFWNSWNFAGGLSPDAAGWEILFGRAFLSTGVMLQKQHWARRFSRIIICIKILDEHSRIWTLALKLGFHLRKNYTCSSGKLDFAISECCKSMNPHAKQIYFIKTCLALFRPPSKFDKHKSRATNNITIYDRFARFTKT